MRIGTLSVGLFLLFAGNAYAQNVTHKIKNGDTLGAIATRHGTTVKALQRANGLATSGRLKLGQKIIIPSALVSSQKRRSARPSANGSYAVKAGDNDTIISRRLGISASELRTMNPGVNWRKLQPGNKLVTSKVAPKPTVRAFVVSAPKVNLGKFARAKGTAVIVRGNSTTNAPVVARIGPNVVARVVDQKNGWVKLQFDGNFKGWVRSDLLIKSAAPLKVSAPKIVATFKPAAPEAVRPGIRTPKITVSIAKATTVAEKAPPKAKADVKRVVNRAASSVRSQYAGPGSPTVVSRAYSFRGVRYVFGGSSRNGTDCSGFTMQVYRSMGIRLPRTSAAQFGVGKSVSRNNLVKGDLVFFNTTGRRISHVGIYVGNGQFIHASSGGRQVRVNALSQAYYNRRYVGARRILKSAPAQVRVSSAPKPRVEKEIAPENASEEPANEGIDITTIPPSGSTTGD